jgi:hypothetical protein
MRLIALQRKKGAGARGRRNGPGQADRRPGWQRAIRSKFKVLLRAAATRWLPRSFDFCIAASGSGAECKCRARRASGSFPRHREKHTLVASFSQADRLC